MKNFQYMHPVFEQEHIDVLSQGLGKVAGVDQGNKPWLVKQQNWVAVPVETGDHLTKEERESLVCVLAHYGYQQSIAVALEHLGDFPQVVRVPSIQEALDEFQLKCGHFWFALYAGQPDWVFLFTKDDYYILAGSEEFVSQFLGCDISEAFAQFYEWATAEHWPTHFQNYLLSLHHKLLEDYQAARPGEIISLA